MTTLNIEKTTREKLKQIRGDESSYDDLINNLIDDKIALESYLPIPIQTIPKFIKQLSRLDDPGYRLYLLAMDG